MRLYDIALELENCIIDGDRGVNTETGEVIDIEKIQQLQMDRDTKIENIALWIKNLKSDKEQLDKEKVRLADKAKACENKIEQLKSLLDFALKGEKYKTANVSLFYSKSTSVEVDESKLDLIPSEYTNVGQITANKEEIKKALKEGKEVPFCRLVEKKNLQLR